MVHHYQTGALAVAIDRLKELRDHAQDRTSVLETIISCCSGIAREAQRPSIADTARSIRSTAIKLYSSTLRADAALVTPLLEEAITKFEAELNWPKPRNSRVLPWRPPKH
jgi:hypothetical protein